MRIVLTGWWGWERINMGTLSYIWEFLLVMVFLLLKCGIRTLKDWSKLQKLWSKFGGSTRLPIIPWNFCILPKEEGGLAPIDIATDENFGCQTDDRCLQGTATWKQWMIYIIMDDTCISNIRDSFRLRDIIRLPQDFIILKYLVLKGIWKAFKGNFFTVSAEILLCYAWMWSSLHANLVLKDIKIWTWQMFINLDT